MSKITKGIARTATEVLKLLWNEGFFEAWRNFSQIEGVLDKKKYHFDSGILGKALERAKYLTRRGKKGNYEYIQKHPFIGEEKVLKTNKKK